jgi:hypothetical protein
VAAAGYPWRCAYTNEIGVGKMKIDSLADYWGKQIRTEKGKWVHPDDKVLLREHRVSIGSSIGSGLTIGHFE